MLESTPRSSLYHVTNQRYERSYTNVFDLHFQGSTIKVRWLILNFLRSSTLKMLESIDTKIKSATCIQPELRKVITMNVCDLNFQGQPSRVTLFFSTLLISLTSIMLESTPRSRLYHVWNRRWERSCKKVFDLDFQGQAIKIEFFRYHRWIPWPRKHTHEKYFQKIRTGRQKSRGLPTTLPSWASKGGFLPWASEG